MKNAIALDIIDDVLFRIEFWFIVSFIMPMIEGIFADSILISVVAVPLVLWLGRQKVYDLFHTQGKWTIALNSVVVINVVAALVHLGFGTRFLDVKVFVWAGILFLAFIWVRTLALVSG